MFRSSKGIWKKESLNFWQQAQVLCPGCFTPYQVLCRRCARVLCPRCVVPPPQVLCPPVPRMFYTIPQLNTFTKFWWMFLVCYLKLLDSSFLFFVERHFYVECYWDI